MSRRFSSMPNVFNQPNSPSTFKPGGKKKRAFFPTDLDNLLLNNDQDMRVDNAIDAILESQMENEADLDHLDENHTAADD